MRQMMARLLEQQGRLIEELTRKGSRFGCDVVASRENDGSVTSLSQLKRLEPPSFDGSTKPIEAEAWLKQMEKIFAAIGCDSEKKTFQKKCFPNSVLNKMEDDLFNLMQGTKSVAEYEKQFTVLSRYVLTIVANKGRGCRRFFEGLHLPTKDCLSVLKLTSYVDLVERVTIAE